MLKDFFPKSIVRKQNKTVSSTLLTQAAL